MEAAYYLREQRDNKVILNCQYWYILSKVYVVKLFNSLFDDGLRVTPYSP